MEEEFTSQLYAVDNLFCPGTLVFAQGHLPTSSSISRAPGSSPKGQKTFKSRRSGWFPLDRQPPGPCTRTWSLRQKPKCQPVGPPLSSVLPVVSAPPTKISLWILPSSSSKASQRLRGKSYFLLFPISSMIIWEGEEKEEMTRVTEGSPGDRIPPPPE